MAEFIDPAIVPKVTLPSGEKVPCMGMGTFGSDRVSAEEVSEAVAGAIRSGYRMFDCAACYGNEHQIGEVFKAAFDEGVVERKDLFIMTKVWNDMHRKVEEACTRSIEDLQCDYVDLYFIHWKILGEMKADGKLGEISTKWFGGDITTVEAAQ